MTNVVNIIGVVKNEGKVVRYVLRDSIGKLYYCTLLDLCSGNFIFGNLSVRKQNNKIGVACKHCKLSDLPVYNQHGQLVSPAKLTILYAIVSGNGKRVGFWVMTATGEVSQMLYNDVVREILQNDSTNAVVSKNNGKYIVKPKYGAFKERTV